MKALILASLIVLAGCDKIPGTAQHEFAMVQDKLASKAFDPKMVEFKDASYSPNGRYVCGAFNETNMFGAHVGFRKFAYDRIGKNFLLNSTEAEERALIPSAIIAGGNYQAACPQARGL